MLTDKQYDDLSKSNEYHTGVGMPPFTIRKVVKINENLTSYAVPNGYSVIPIHTNMN